MLLSAIILAAGQNAFAGSPAPPQLASSGNFYVSISGQDTWSGTLPAPNSTRTDGPFATIARAQKAVEAILANPQGRTGMITVQIRGGNYHLSQPLSFGTADSGTSSLRPVWQNYPGETPVISGGTRVTGWTNISNNLWQLSLPSSTQYFEQLFYNGQRRLRPRLGGSALGTYYRVAASVFVPLAETNCPVLVAGQGYECFDRFQYNASDPINANWSNLSPPSSNPCGERGNTFPAGDIALYVFEQMGTSKLRVSCVDSTNHIMYATGPTQTDPLHNGFVPGHRYIVENVKNALTQPGQWFLDRSVTPWELSYLAMSGENPNNDTVIVPQQAQVLVATGLHWVTFQGLTFEHDNYTVPPQGYAYVRLETPITSAVSCQNCQNVTFDGDTITQTSGTGIDFTTTSATANSAYNTFKNGAIYDVGSHGIRIGLLSHFNDTDANVPQFTTVQNNVIEGFGRVFPKGLGIAQGCNHDNLYTHNDIYDGYGGGILIGAMDCSPGNANSRGTFNNVASFNHIYNLGQGLTNDFSCVYFNTSSPTYVPPGNKALNNRCHDVVDASTLDTDGYGGQGIYTDDYTGLIDVENNLIYRVSSSAIAQTCGAQVSNQPNIFKNNILAFARRGIKQQGCTPLSSSIRLFEMTNNLVLFDKGRVQAGCFSCLSGTCSSVLPATVTFQSNMYCYVQGSGCTLPSKTYTFFSGDSTPGQWGGCSKTSSYTSLTAWQNEGEDTYSVQQNPKFANPYYPGDDFSLPNGSPGVGFVVFDPSQAGRTSSTISPPAVGSTFVIQLLNPVTDY